MEAALGPLQGGADAPPPAAPADSAGAFSLHGQALQVVCVDDRLPSHQHAGANGRVRQRYHSAEVAHFDYGGHRYAILACAAGTPPPAPVDETRSGVLSLLTNRELQIVQLICNGLLTKQVSDRLRISEFTVRSYLKTIYCKLGVRSRGAMVYAYAQSFARQRRGA